MTFLDLVIAAAAEDFAPAGRHGAAEASAGRLGLDAVRRAPRRRTLEIAAFRDVYLGRGIDGIAEALERAEEADHRRTAPPSRRRTAVARRLARGAKISSCA